MKQYVVEGNGGGIHVRMDTTHPEETMAYAKIFIYKHRPNATDVELECREITTSAE